MHVALVFWSIQKTALANFVLDTNRCWWKNDPTLAPKLAASVRKHHQRMSQKSLSNPTEGSFFKMKNKSLTCLSNVMTARIACTSESTTLQHFSRSNVGYENFDRNNRLVPKLYNNTIDL